MLVLLGAIVFGIILVLAAVENEKPGLATISLVCAFTLLALLGDFNIFLVAKAQPLFALLLLVSYFVVGILWSLAKWWFFVRSKVEVFNQYAQRYKLEKGLPAFHKLSPEQIKQMSETKNAYGEYLYGDVGLFSVRHASQRPDVKYHKGRIIIWMAYWPWSATWTIINDPVKKVFKGIFQHINSLYESISRRAFKDIDHS